MAPNNTVLILYMGGTNLSKYVTLIIDFDTIWVTIKYFVTNDEMNKAARVWGECKIAANNNIVPVQDL